MTDMKKTTEHECVNVWILVNIYRYIYSVQIRQISQIIPHSEALEVKVKQSVVGTGDMNNYMFYIEN